MKEPKDLGIEFGSKEEAAWTAIRNTQEETIRNSIINLEIAQNLLLISERNIEREKKEFAKKGKT